MYVGGLLNNVEQHTNIDHSNDVENHANPGLATIQFCLIKICLDFCDEQTIVYKDSETSQTSDDIYQKYNFVKRFEEINVF